LTTTAGKEDLEIVPLLTTRAGGESLEMASLLQLQYMSEEWIFFHRCNSSKEVRVDMIPLLTTDVRKECREMVTYG
jgi:hypothetical protein